MMIYYFYMKGVIIFLIKPENTAIRNGHSKSASWISENVSNLSDTVFDVGFGWGRNTEYLRSKGFQRIYGIETPTQLERKAEMRHLFDGVSSEFPAFPAQVILNSFVLNVIPDRVERSDLLHKMYNALSPQGLLIIEVRGVHGIAKAKTKTPYLDGFLMGVQTVKTFQKGYTMEELISFVSDYGTLVETFKTSDSVAVVIRKDESL